MRHIGRRDRAWRGRLSADPAPDRWPLLAPLAALIAGWAVMVWPWLVGRVTIPWDAKAQFLPQIQFLAQSLARGESPFWAPYVFSGQVQIADPQSMIFSPPFLLLALVNGNPSAWSVDVTTLLAGLVGAVALLLWFRDQGWHWAGALIAGLVFAFGASMAWRLQHTGQVLSLAYWPIALLALERTMARRSFAYAIALGLLAAAILLGRDQVALLVLYVLAAFAVWRVFDAPEPLASLRGVALPLGLAGIVAILTAALPLLMTALLASDSNRPSIDFESAGRGSLHPALLITSLIPQLYGAAFRMEDYWGPPSFAWNDTGLFIAQNMGQIYMGAVPALMIVMAAVRGQLWAREIRFFTIALGIITLYALGWYTPVFRVFYALLPGVSLYRRPADATFVMGALGAVLSGYAVHRLFARPWERITENVWLAAGAIAALAVAAALALALKFDRVQVLPYPLIAAVLAMGAAGVAVVLARQRIALEPWTAALILAGITAADLGWNNGPSTSSGLPPKVYEALDPHTQNATIRTLKALVEAGQSDTRRDRIELLGLGYHWPNASLTHRLENTLGANPVRLGLYADATGAEDTIGLAEQRKFSALLPSYRSRLVDLLGLRYIAAGAPLQKVDPKLHPGDWPLVAKTRETWIYENPRALPRVSFARQAIGADFDAILRTGAWPAFDPAASVLLPQGQGAYFSDGGGTTAARIRIARYGHTRIDIEASSTTGGFVVLNDLWHPWWFAAVDGAPAPIHRANVLFRAVEVPRGTHTVRFEFRPLRGAWEQLWAPTPLDTPVQ